MAERGFSFAGKCKPVLDKYSRLCHERLAPATNGKTIPDPARPATLHLLDRDGDPEAMVIRDAPVSATDEEVQGRVPPRLHRAYGDVRVGGWRSDLPTSRAARRSFTPHTTELRTMLTRDTTGSNSDGEAWTGRDLDRI